MCGISGFIDPKHMFESAQGASILRRMTDQISHRGPDDAGYWQDDRMGTYLGHRRLSILDVSPEGRQPMTSACGRYVIVFNGEIYNHHELRLKLEKQVNGLQWRGHSDTEVMLAAISAWGVKSALELFNGMFAFALWDKREASLVLARDRLGEKPLYYGFINGILLFGSELKVLKAHPAWQADIDRGALTLFLRNNYIPAPYSIYQGIQKLSPASFVVFSFATRQAETEGPQKYWSAFHIAENAMSNRINLSDSEACDELERLLMYSVRLRMEADVPLGAFLSGGVDSSAVVALMQAQSKRPVKTFTIGFSEQGYNEAEHAHAVAKHLGTEHTELFLTSKQAIDVIPKLPWIYDEPFSDSSQIPTFLVSEMTRHHVTVALSGDGGDELFGGYTRYFWAMDIWKTMQFLPLPLRRNIGKLLHAIKPDVWDGMVRGLSPILPRRLRQSHPSDKIKKLAYLFQSDSPHKMYKGLVSHWLNPAEVVIGGSELPTSLTEIDQWPQLSDFVHHMMYQDMTNYLPDDILVKVDRASMGVGLEARVPFLDHRLVEFAWKIPLSQKIRDGAGKWLLKQVLYRHIPRELIERPKMGFGIPLSAWLRGPLRDWAEALLSEQRLKEDGFFNVEPVRSAWLNHVNEKSNMQYQLWDVLMFQAWLDSNR